MIASILLLAAAGAPAAPGGDTRTLTCSLELADRSRFGVTGRFDEDRLRSNLSDLVRGEGEFESAPPDLVVTSDGTETYRWRRGGRPQGEFFEASLTRYGGDVAILLVERHKFVGRHWGRALVGIGLCDVGGQIGGKKS
ncbi:MAG TPA: hypothetical protein VF782_02885 [Allosphingosinicella sp.]